MKKISADFVFPVSSAPIKEGVVVLDYNGKILDITSRDEHDPSTIDIHQGVLVPGFINTHCHLELSHMKGMVDTGTGLIPFIHAVVTMRDIPMEKILDAIDQADQDMYDNGIVAVGDISNKLDTVKRKNESPIRYYTFVEMFDFLQNDQAEQHYQNFSEAFKGQSEQGPNRKSCVPHAPYTVSPKLFELIEQTNTEDNLTISIHNQETPHENALFLEKTGDLLGFFSGFGFSLDHFQPTGQTAIHYALQHMNPAHRSLFVHNCDARPSFVGPML
jgi:cytosine/adenosine deaminase-related metal-dependent hydrolase